MKDQQTSYRQILRSSSLIGGASVANIVIGLLRGKAVAVLLGPAGVGLMGLLNNVLATAATIAGLGISSVGTRQVAEAAANADPHSVWGARHALRLLAVTLALVAGVAMWLGGDLIASTLLDGALPGRSVAWLGLGVSFSVIAASQTAQLNGLRRIGDLAGISMLGAFLSSTLGVALLWLGGAGTLVAFTILGPLISMLVGFIFVSRLPNDRFAVPAAVLRSQWAALIQQGLPFVVAGMAGTFAQLFVRSALQRKLGLESTGYFQSSWMISETYIAFVLGAMGTDFYPRLTGVIRDAPAANRVANEQAEVALLLAGPVVLGTLALAPWLLPLLYSQSFAESVWTLRWQVLGDVLKVASWPLGFIMLAAGDTKAFMVVEWAAYATFALISVVAMPRVGVMATGVGFLAMYAVLLPLVYWAARRRTQFRWSSQVRLILLTLFGSACAVVGLARIHVLLAGAVGLATAFAFGLYALGRFSELMPSSGPLRLLAALGQRLRFRPREP